MHRKDDMASNTLA